MNRFLQIAGALLAGALFASGAQRNAPKAAPPHIAAKPAPRSNIPRASAPGAKPQRAPVIHPGSLAARLYKANPQQREMLLEKLPPDRQAQLRKNLEWFDHLNKQQQAVEIKYINHYAGLSPQKRALVNQQMAALAHLPPARGEDVRYALNLLQGMNKKERESIIKSDGFRSHYSPDEQKIISDLLENMLPPM